MVTLETRATAITSFIVLCIIALALSPGFVSAQGRGVQLSPGFDPDPYIIPIMSRGNYDVSRAGLPSRSTCVGYVNQVANFTLSWSGSDQDLNIFFVADNGVDTTLIVGYQNQEFFCNDDSDGMNPGIRFTSTASGLFDIWVGTHASGQIVSGRLYITEHSLGPSDLVMDIPLTDTRFAGFQDLTSQYTPGQAVFAAELYCQSGYPDACTLFGSSMQYINSIVQQCLSGGVEQCAWFDQLVYDYQLAAYVYQQQFVGQQPAVSGQTVYSFGGGSSSSGSSYCPVNDPLICDMLRQANSAMARTQDYLGDLDAQGFTAFSGGLMERCQNGDIQACNTYNQRADAAIQAWDIMYGPGSGWAESFSYGN